MYTTREFETQNLGSHKSFPKKELGGQKNFSYLGTYVLFVEQPVVSLSLYNGAIQWLVGTGWEGPVLSNRSQ